MAGEHERRARRDRERAEREWRRQELDAARLKAEREDELKRARRSQVQQRERQVAVEAQRERAEFYRILEEQKRAEQLSQTERAERQEVGGTMWGPGDLGARCKEGCAGLAAVKDTWSWRWLIWQSLGNSAIICKEWARQLDH